MSNKFNTELIVSTSKEQNSDINGSAVCIPSCLTRG